MPGVNGAFNLLLRISSGLVCMRHCDIQEMLETVRCAESSSLWSIFFLLTGHDAIGSVTSLTKKASLRVWIQTHAETKQCPLRKETL